MHSKCNRRQVETNVQSTNRLVVEKPPATKKEVLPMKFKMEWPDSVKDRKVSKDDTNISSAKVTMSVNSGLIIFSRMTVTMRSQLFAQGLTPHNPLAAKQRLQLFVAE